MQVLELLEPSDAPFPDDQYIWVVDFHKFSVADMDPKVAGACLALFGGALPRTPRRHDHGRRTHALQRSLPRRRRLRRPGHRQEGAFRPRTRRSRGTAPWDVVMSSSSTKRRKGGSRTRCARTEPDGRTSRAPRPWLAATAVDVNGTVHKYQRAEEARAGAEACKRGARGRRGGSEREAAATRVRGDAAQVPKSLGDTTHTPCASFVRSEACRRARRATSRPSSPSSLRSPVRRAFEFYKTQRRRIFRRDGMRRDVRRDVLRVRGERLTWRCARRDTRRLDVRTCDRRRHLLAGPDGEAFLSATRREKYTRIIYGLL